jgi:hypothetical protein
MMNLNKISWSQRKSKKDLQQVCNGQMVGKVFICTNWSKTSVIFLSSQHKMLNHVQFHSIKCKKWTKYMTEKLVEYNLIWFWCFHKNVATEMWPGKANKSVSPFSFLLCNVCLMFRTKEVSSVVSIVHSGLNSGAHCPEVFLGSSWELLVYESYNMAGWNINDYSLMQCYDM